MGILHIHLMIYLSECTVIRLCSWLPFSSDYTKRSRRNLLGYDFLTLITESTHKVNVYSISLISLLKPIFLYLATIEHSCLILLVGDWTSFHHKEQGRMFLNWKGFHVIKTWSKGISIECCWGGDYIPIPDNTPDQTSENGTKRAKLERVKSYWEWKYIYVSLISLTFVFDLAP